MGRARTLAAGLARVARDAGPRAAVTAAVQVSTRWVVKQSRLGLDTLEDRMERRFAVAADRVEEELAWLASQRRALEARQAAVEDDQRDIIERLHALSDDAAALHGLLGDLTTAVDTYGLHQRGLYDGMWRLGDSVRVLTRLTESAPHANGRSRGERRHDGVDSVRISVVVPVRNRADRIPACIGSILSQTGADFDVIVVDDASTDDLARALAPFTDDPRVHVLTLARVGDVAARNAGIAFSTGDVIVNFDSDNRMFAGYLGLLTEVYALQPDVECAVAAQLWDDGGAHVHLRHDEFDWSKLLARDMNLDTNCFSYRRRLRDELGDWDSSLSKHSDWELALRYTRDHEPARVDAVASFYDARRTPTRISYGRASLPTITRVTARYADRRADPLKVLVYTYDYPQLSESYVATEVDWMRRQGVEVEVFAACDPEAPGHTSVRVHRGDVAAAIDQFSPDVVHCHWLTQLPPVAAIARQRDLPVTVRSHAFEYTAEALDACLADGVTRSIYLYPHLIDGTRSDAANIVSVNACFDSERYYPRIERDRWLVVRTAACLPTKDLSTFFHVAAASPKYRFVLALAHIATVPDLPAELEALNASLGSPVDLRWDVPYAEISALVAGAGLYLHTFGFVQPFGMPMSIAEAMACGVVPIVRDSPAGRAYAGECGLYYDSTEDAVRVLDTIAEWGDATLNARSVACADHAYANYADEVVLPTILDDWRALVGAVTPATMAARP